MNIETDIENKKLKGIFILKTTETRTLHCCEKSIEFKMVGVGRGAEWPDHRKQ